jgi:hypothetical protein
MRFFHEKKVQGKINLKLHVTVLKIAKECLKPALSRRLLLHAPVGVSANGLVK